MSRKENSLPRILWSSSTMMVEQDCACAAEIPRLWTSEPGLACLTDCACPDGIVTSHVPPLSTVSTWQVASGLYRAPLSQGHELSFDVAGFSGVVVLNEPARRILDVFRVPTAPAYAREAFSALSPRVVEDAVETLSTLGLLRPAEGRAAEPRFPTSEVLTAWLHVTQRCNLHCTYCYAPRGDKSMDVTTGRAAVDAVFRSALRQGFSAVKLKYAGGEPALNFPTVRSIHSYAQRKAAKAGLVLHEVMLSNAIALSRDMLTWMRDASIRLAVSLDGVGGAHNVHRAGSSGKGSYSRVVQSIDRAIGIGLRPHLSITVTASNVQALPEVVNFALDRELLFNFNFVRPSRTATSLAASPRALIDGLRDALAVIEARLPSYRLIDGLLDRCAMTLPHTSACGAGSSYLVVGPDGGIARCHMEMERRVTSVLERDPLQEVKARTEAFLSVDERQSCRECLWRYWCAGGCPLLAQQRTNATGGPSPYCEVYRALLPGLLHLEGLRLLKWEGAET